MGIELIETSLPILFRVSVTVDPANPAIETISPATALYNSTC
jgi:hypothetical protein